MRNKNNFSILSITTQKPHSTGSGTYLTELVKAFHNSGCSQAVVAGVYHSDQVNFPEGTEFYPVYYTEPGKVPSGEDISFPVLGMSDIMPYPSTRYSELDEKMASELESRFIPVIQEAVSQLDPDIILCHHLYLLTAMVRRAFPGRQVWGLSHGSDLRQIRNCSFRREWIKSAICDLNRILVLQSAQRQVLLDYYGASEEKITVVGSGYNPEIFNCQPSGEDCHMTKSPVPDPVRIIYAGKLSREKGLLPLLQCLNDLSEDQDLPSLSLSLAGGCKDPLIAERLGRNSCPSLKPGILQTEPYQINYLGVLSHQELAEAFRNSHIFVLPSYYEGIPLVLTEAMACGLVPVSSDLPGLRDWLDHSVPDHQVIFVKLPDMVSPGVPVSSQLCHYTSALAQGIRKAVMNVEKNYSLGYRPVPNTGRVTWQGVADRILSLAHSSVTSETDEEN